MMRVRGSPFLQFRMGTMCVQVRKSAFWRTGGHECQKEEEKKKKREMRGRKVKKKRYKTKKNEVGEGRGEGEISGKERQRSQRTVVEFEFREDRQRHNENKREVSLNQKILEAIQLLRVREREKNVSLLVALLLFSPFLHSFLHDDLSPSLFMDNGQRTRSPSPSSSSQPCLLHRTFPPSWVISSYDPCSC